MYVLSYYFVSFVQSCYRCIVRCLLCFGGSVLSPPRNIRNDSTQENTSGSSTSWKHKRIAEETCIIEATRDTNYSSNTWYYSIPVLKGTRLKLVWVSSLGAVSYSLWFVGQFEWQRVRKNNSSGIRRLDLSIATRRWIGSNQFYFRSLILPNSVF